MRNANQPNVKDAQGTYVYNGPKIHTAVRPGKKATVNAMYLTTKLVRRKNLELITFTQYWDPWENSINTSYACLRCHRFRAKLSVCIKSTIKYATRQGRGEDIFTSLISSMNLHLCKGETRPITVVKISFDMRNTDGPFACP